MNSTNIIIGSDIIGSDIFGYLYSSKILWNSHLILTNTSMATFSDSNPALMVLKNHYDTYHDRKTGSQQIKDNANSILNGCVIPTTEMNQARYIIKHRRCKVSTLSLDTRGRAQRKMRLGPKERRNFRPWHITWMAKYGSNIPLDQGPIEYIHRCHENNCCEPKHGYWGTSAQNKATNDCRTASHIVLQLENGEYRVKKICPHKPSCSRPVIVRLDEFGPVKPTRLSAAPNIPDTILETVESPN